MFKRWFCLEHYDRLTENQKNKLKTNNVVNFILGIILPILLTIITIPIIVIYSVFFLKLSDALLTIFALIIATIMTIFIYAMTFLKGKRIQKIIENP